MSIKKNYWMSFENSDDMERIEREIAKLSIELDRDILEVRALIYKAFAYDPEIKAKIIEFIKKNGQRTD